jgi:hypothetical protein
MAAAQYLAMGGRKCRSRRLAELRGHAHRRCRRYGAADVIDGISSTIIGRGITFGRTSRWENPSIADLLGREFDGSSWLRRTEGVSSSFRLRIMGVFNADVS